MAIRTALPASSTLLALGLLVSLMSPLPAHPARERALRDADDFLLRRAH
jgi:hypothetical protein